MSFFNDDPFDEIVREFFGENQTNRRKYSEKIIEGEDEERTIDFIESGKNIFLIFEIPGYSEEDVSVKLKGKVIEITAKKKNLENVQGYLSRKLRGGVYLKKTLPNFINFNKFNHTFKNGILEIVFDRKKWKIKLK